MDKKLQLFQDLTNFLLDPCFISAHGLPQTSECSFCYVQILNPLLRGIGCARVGAPLTQPGRAHFRLLSPSCHVRRGTLDSLQFSAGPLHHAGPCGVWDRIGESRSRRLSCRFFRFTFILVRLAYFTFDTTNLSLQYGSILSRWDCKFKIVWSFFPIIFPRPSSLRKETWTPCNRGGARMRFVGYFSSLNHSLVRNKFIDITAGFARFV